MFEEREVHVEHDLDMFEQFSHLKVCIELKSELGFNVLRSEQLPGEDLSPMVSANSCY